MPPTELLLTLQSLHARASTLAEDSPRADVSELAKIVASIAKAVETYVRGEPEPVHFVADAASSQAACGVRLTAGEMRVTTAGRVTCAGCVGRTR